MTSNDERVKGGGVKLKKGIGGTSYEEEEVNDGA